MKSAIQERRQYALNISSNKEAEVGKYALCYGTQAARRRFSSKYPQYKFKRNTENTWEKIFTKDRELRVGQLTRAKTPNKVNNSMFLARAVIVLEDVYTS